MLRGDTSERSGQILRGSRGLARHFEHFFNRRARPVHNVFGKFDARLESLEAFEEFFGRVHQHIFAMLRRLARRGCRDERFVRDFPA